MNYLTLFCCDEYVNLCVIAKKCSNEVRTGILAVEAGAHIVYFKHGNLIVEQTVTLSIGDELIVKNPFKRLGAYTFVVQTPSGNLSKCYTFTANNIIHEPEQSATDRIIVTLVTQNNPECLQDNNCAPAPTNPECGCNPQI